jgi:hypothetical protein
MEFNTVSAPVSAPRQSPATKNAIPIKMTVPRFFQTLQQATQLAERRSKCGGIVSSAATSTQSKSRQFYAGKTTCADFAHRVSYSLSNLTL